MDLLALLLLFPFILFNYFLFLLCELKQLLYLQVLVLDLQLLSILVILQFPNLHLQSPYYFSLTLPWRILALFLLHSMGTLRLTRTGRRPRSSQVTRVLLGTQDVREYFGTRLFRAAF